MKKKILSLLLCAAMALSLTGGLTARAAEPETHCADCAQALYTMGLFRGVGANEDGTPIFALDREATRMQGLIMLIRLLGEEEDALAYEGGCPFTDVSGNSAKYAGYAFSKGYTAGSTPTVFGNGPLKVNAFLTFTLRALGYDDKAGDFTYGTALRKAAVTGLADLGDFADGGAVMRRDDCARIAYNALLTDLKSGESSLLDSLVAAGSIRKDKVAEAGITSDTQPRYRCDWDLNGANATALDAVRRDAPYYGLPADIQWVADMKTEEDLVNNIMVSHLIGHLDTRLPLSDYVSMGRFTRYFDRNYQILCALHPELNGAMINADVGYNHTPCPDDTIQITVELKEAALTSAQIRARSAEAKAKAEAVVAELRERGKLTDEMTDYRKMEVLYRYLRSLDVQYGGGPDEPRGSNMLYDTAYSVLVSRKAACVGRAAAMNVLLHLEGIPAAGVQGRFHEAPENCNHVLTLALLDGREYAINWGGGISVRPVEEFSRREGFDFFPESLALARAAMAKISGEK